MEKSKVVNDEIRKMWDLMVTESARLAVQEGELREVRLLTTHPLHSASFLSGACSQSAPALPRSAVRSRVGLVACRAMMS